MYSLDLNSTTLEQIYCPGPFTHILTDREEDIGDDTHTGSHMSPKGNNVNWFLRRRRYEHGLLTPIILHTVHAISFQN